MSMKKDDTQNKVILLVSKVAYVLQYSTYRPQDVVEGQLQVTEEMTLWAREGCGWGTLLLAVALSHCSLPRPGPKGLKTDRKDIRKR